MGDISRYILVDAEGTIDDSDHPNAESARGAQRRADRPKAIAEEVYTYSETRLVDMPDPAEAQRLYARAAAHGHTEAFEMLDSEGTA